jgi:ElaB/YqjD/DUF883 family membrane-anchored ribosome-binding protein
MLTPGEMVRPDRISTTQSGAGDIGLYGGVQQTFEPATPIAIAMPSAHPDAQAVFSLLQDDLIYLSAGAFSIDSRPDHDPNHEDPVSGLGESQSTWPQSNEFAAPASNDASSYSHDGWALAPDSQWPVALAHGSGSVSAAVPSVVIQGVNETHASQIPAVAAPPSGDLPTTPIAAVAAVAAHIDNVTTTLAERIDSSTQAAIDTVANTVSEIASTTTSMIAVVADDVADRVEQTRAAIEQDVSNIASHVDNSVSEIASTATSTIAAVADDITDRVAQTGAAIEQSVSNVGSTATGTVASVADDVAAEISTIALTAIEATTSVADDLAGLVGNDPAAGIATLVSLVSAADMFALHDEGASPDGFGSALGAIGAADVLADLVPADVLLGGIDDHHDQPGHLGIDGSSLGLDDLGLGL